MLFQGVQGYFIFHLLLFNKKYFNHNILLTALCHRYIQSTVPRENPVVKPTKVQSYVVTLTERR